MATRPDQGKGFVNRISCDSNVTPAGIKQDKRVENQLHRQFQFISRAVFPCEWERCKDSLFYTMTAWAFHSIDISIYGLKMWLSPPVFEDDETVG